MYKKLLICVAALALTTSIFAAQSKAKTIKMSQYISRSQLPQPVTPYSPGVYYGVQGGLGMTHWKSSMHATVNKDNHLALRMFSGVDINRYFAVEAGLTDFFGRTNLDAGKVKMISADLMGKIRAHVWRQFSLFAKAGADYLYSFHSVEKSRGTINLAYGLGASYCLTPNIITDLSWTRFGGRQKINHNVYIPYTDLLAIGIRYKFDIK